MKNNFLIIFTFLFFFCGCELQNKDPYDFQAKDFVDLYDYKNITIDRKYTKISSEDIDTIINLDFSTKHYYRQDNNSNTIKEEDIVLIDIECSDEKFKTKDWYYEVGSGSISEDFDNLLIGKATYSNFKYTYKADKEYVFKVILKGKFILNDSTNENMVCEFYGFSSINDVYEYLTQRAQKEILYNYALEQILTNSKLKSFPKSIIVKANSYIEKSFDNNNDISNIEEIQQIAYDYYYEIMVLKAILESENIEITANDMDKKISNLSEKNSIPIEDIEKLYSSDDIYYLTMTDILKPILSDYIILTD